MSHGGSHISAAPETAFSPESRGYLINQSGIGGSVAKLIARPAGWVETDGYTEDFHQEDGGGCTRYFHGPWTGRHAFREWVMGYSTTIPVGSSRILFRSVPMQHPEMYWLYAQSISFKGQARVASLAVPLRDGLGQPLDGVDESILFYDGSSLSDALSCIAKVEYRSLPYEVRTDSEIYNGGLPGSTPELNRYVIREKTYGMRAISIDKGLVEFIEGPASVKGKDIPGSGGQILVPGNHLRYTWIDVPDLPEAAITACVGRVNATAFDGARGWPTYPAETLLCLPPEIKRYRTPVGRIAWRITYVFAQSPDTKGWNAFPSATGRYFLARFRNRSGSVTGTLSGTFSGSIAGELVGTIDGVDGVHYPNGTLDGEISGEFTGDDNGDGTVTGSFVGSMSGTYTEGSGSYVLLGNFNGSITGQIERLGEKVYRTAPFDLLFTPVAPVAYQ